MTKTKIFGSVIVGALFLAYEAYSVYKFVQDCKDREKNSYSMLEKLKSGLHNLSIAETNITILRNDIEKNYKKLFHDLTAESFGKFVKEAIQTANNAEKQTKSLKQGAEQLKEFYFNINKTWTSDGKINFNRVEKLVTTLNSGLSKQTYKLTCMRKKLSIIKTITDSCANGLGSYESLWNASRQLEGKTLQNCIENNQYLTQKGVEAVIAGAMEARGKNLKCVRNDKNKFQLACQKWLEDAPNSKIMESLDDVDLEDVKYFISKCPPGEVNSQMTGTICSFKEDNTKKIDSVYNRFPKYDRAGLLKTWNLCPLSTIQRSSICSNKASMYSFPYIRSKYLNYDEADVQNVYQNCVLVMNPQTEFMVCMIYNNGGLDNSMMNRYIKLYGLAAIKAYVTGPNCTADQSFGKR